MNSEKIKNPLKPVNIFFSVISVMYILVLIPGLITGSTLVEVIASHKIKAIGLCLNISFIICYLRKTILAWWIALFFILIMPVCSIIIKNKTLDGIGMLTFGLIYLFTIYYFGPKYTTYKGYLKSNT